MAELGNFMAQLDQRAPERTQGFESQVFNKLGNHQKAKHFPDLFRNPPPRKPTPPGATKTASGLDRGFISPEIKGGLDKNLKKSNPEAQERAFVDFMQTKYNRLEKSGTFKELGKSFVSKDGKDITISEAGLLAAAHRTGAGKVREYLNYMRSNNWKSNFSGLKDKIAQSYEYIEKRLKTFQDKAVRKR